MIPSPIPEEAAVTRPYCKDVTVGPPPGVTDADCGTVEMLVEPFRLGDSPLGRAYYAYYRPSPAEVAALQSGGFLELALFGGAVQPFSLNVWPTTTTDNREALAADLADLLDEDDAASVVDLLWMHGYLTKPAAHSTSPQRADSRLAAQLARYLLVRKHTLNTAHLTGVEQLRAEAEYVLGEATELRDAVVELAEAHERGEATAEHLAKIRHEIADVALADTALAGMVPGGVAVEACIVEKTEADRGRG